VSNNINDNNIGNNYGEYHKLIFHENKIKENLWHPKVSGCFFSFSLGASQYNGKP
jgi:hypothetical protein